jgi:hypothetical protein
MMGSMDDDAGRPSAVRDAVGALVGAGVGVARVALRPAGYAYGAARRAERDARGAILDAAGRRALAVLDVLLASAFVEIAAERVLARAQATGAPQRIAAGLLDDGIAEDIAARVLNGPEIERVVDVALDSERLRETLVAALERPGAERLIASALDSPGMERLVRRAVDSRLADETVVRLVDETVSRLAEREALWVLIDEIARSPAVMEAISQQGMGFADQVAGDMRERSRNADARLEHVALRLFRRRRAGPPGPLGEPGA